MSVPVELQEAVEKIALERFPGSSATWIDQSPGFILMEIPEADYGSSQDIDANGLALGPPEPGGNAVFEGLEEKLQQYVRAQSEH